MRLWVETDGHPWCRLAGGVAERDRSHHYAQVITGVTLHSRMRGSARERLAGLGSQTNGDIVKTRRLTASAVAAVVIAVVGAVVPQQAQAAGCTVTTPDIHFSTNEPGRFNFKPLVKCTTPEKYQLFLNHRVQYLSGSKWVTTVWTKKTLNQSLSYVRVSLSRTCTTGTFR